LGFRVVERPRAVSASRHNPIATSATAALLLQLLTQEVLYPRLDEV
jgi:hypothetical protein